MGGKHTGTAEIESFVGWKLLWWVSELMGIDDGLRSCFVFFFVFAVTIVAVVSVSAVFHSNSTAYCTSTCTQRVLAQDKKHRLHVQRNFSISLPATAMSVPSPDYKRQQSHETLGLLAGPQQVRAWPQRQRRGGRLRHGEGDTGRGEDVQARTPT